MELGPRDGTLHNSNINEVSLYVISAARAQITLHEKQKPFCCPCRKCLLSVDTNAYIIMWSYMKFLCFWDDGGREIRFRDMKEKQKGHQL